MQKGIGAAPFAIVAALIVAMAAGALASPSRPKRPRADVALSIADIDDSNTSFNEPGTGDEAGSAHGGGITVENREHSGRRPSPRAPGTSGAAEAKSGAWVEVQGNVRNAADDGNETRSFTMMPLGQR